MFRTYCIVSLIFLLTWLEKAYSASFISPDLEARLEKDGKATVLVFFDSTEEICNPKLQGRSPFDSERSSVLTNVKNQLETKMLSSQSGVANLLSEKQKSVTGLKFTQFWITNQILIHDADLALVKEMSQAPNVTFISEPPELEPVTDPNTKTWMGSFNPRQRPNGEPQPNLKFIKVPEAWELLGGKKGDGIVIGIIDSGVHGLHKNLNSSFLGEYGWLDPTNATKSEPHDTSFHGTHVAGFIVGAEGIGVAPNSKWMACAFDEYDHKNFFEQIVKCTQFMICPTLPDGSKPDCSKAPHIINNSWGIRAYMLNNIYIQPHLKTLDMLIACYQTVGIITVFSLGNEGQLGCNTSRYPTYNENVIGVGYTDLNDTVQLFSSRGPTPDGRVAPDICAPGKNLLGPYPSDSNDDYAAEVEGTSFAAPHVTGAIALLLNKNPELTFKQIREMLRQSAKKIPQTPADGEFDNCGNITAAEFPNNLMGYGRLNVLKLLQTDPPTLL